MAYEIIDWKNKGETGAKPINRDNLRHMDNGILNLDTYKAEIMPLLTVSDAAPAECERGDLYYNTTTELIYVATQPDTWSEEGTTPSTFSLYVDLSSSKLYYYDGTNFNSYGSGGGGETLPVGIILPFSDDTIPEGYMLCDGAAISRTTYSTLFGIIGTTYGVGDGSTTFNLPNLKGKVPVGQDISDTDFDVLGETGGEKEHTLTVNEMPSHAHSYTYSTSVSDWPSRIPLGSNAGVGTSGAGISTTGGDQAHNNLQPYIVINYIIKVSQTTSTQAQVVDVYSTSTTDSYSCNYVNNAINDIYSTNEVKTNKIWVDNKPIYRKVIANEVDMVNGSEISLSSISNMSSLVSIQSKELKVSDNVVFYNNYYDSSTNKFNLFHYIAHNSLYLYAGSNTHYTTTVIIEYTKTTD